MINLESKWFYRLIKVVYLFFLAVGFIGVLFMGWALKPYQYVNDEDSYLVCPHGLHSFNEAELYLPTDSKKFGSYSDKKARDLCFQDAIKNYKNRASNNKSNGTILFKEEVTPAIARAELKRRAMLRQSPQKFGHYEINVEYKKAGSWVSAIKLWFFGSLIGSLIVFLILNVIKQSLLYIVYGKKFTLNWSERI